MWLEPGRTYGEGNLAGPLAKGRGRNKPLLNCGPAGTEPTDVILSMVRTWRGSEVESRGDGDGMSLAHRRP